VDISLIIRAGQAIDLESCLDMAERFYEVAGYNEDIPIDRDSCRTFMNVSIQQGLLFVADTGKQIVGFIVGIASPSIVNKDYLSGAELAWWVEPEHRKGTTGIKLVKAVEKSAKELGVRMWSMMSLEAQDPEKIEKLYFAMGYKRTERTYVRIL